MVPYCTWVLEFSFVVQVTVAEVVVMLDTDMLLIAGGVVSVGGGVTAHAPSPAPRDGHASGIVRG